MAAVRVIGPGRAGGAVMAALAEGSWRVEPPLGRHDDVRAAARDVDLLVIATPDGAIADVAAAVTPRAQTVVMHLAGSLGLSVLAPHPRVAAMHPLMALPDAATGAQRLRSGGWFAIAGDDLARRVVIEFGGTPFIVDDDKRPLYHAAAVVASNHVVALLGQVERIAAEAEVPFDAFIELVRGTIENVADLGPVAALTGPAARGDQATIDRHLAALDPSERELYQVLVAAARGLVS